MQSSQHMEPHTPASPNRGAKKEASVSRMPHMLTRFSTKQAVLSPAPCMAPLATMLAPNIGSAKASMRSTRAPSAMTAASAVKMPISAGANTHSPMPDSAMMPMPMPVQSQANRLAMSFRLAPTACPMRAMAASWMP